MGRHAICHQTAAGSDLGIIVLNNGATVRAVLYELILGTDSAPADFAGEFVVNRSTTSGVGGSALTEVPLDSLTVAPTTAATGGTFATTQPVDTAASELLMIGLNQRATFRWVAAPGGELIGIAAANNGLFLRSVAHGATPNVNATMHWWE